MSSPALAGAPLSIVWFELIVEGAPYAIVLADQSGTIRLLNAKAERLFGYGRAELLGKPIESLVPAEFRSRHPDQVVAFHANPQARAMGAGRDLYGLRKDGIEVPIEIGLSPIDTSDGLFTIAAISDITDRKRHEQELEAFVYTASHDLRSPLTGVSTVAQWILEDDHSLGSETRDRLLLIQGRMARMHRLLDDIRDYARAGLSIEALGSPVSAAALVADIAATLHVPPGFSIGCDPSLQDILLARVPLELVLHNLIGNAIKHHDRPAGTVTVSAVPREGWYRFSVVDDGPGIADEYREVVFEMFRTLQPRDVVEGSGMGLALVRKIVAKLGGDIGIEPSRGRGAHFWFDWPRP
jgi:PAS domain S-box-containing protein